MLYKKASFLDDFDLPEVTHASVKKQLAKVTKKHSVSKKKNLESMPLVERLSYITNEVLKILGRYKNFVKIIRTEEEFNAYIDKAIKYGYMAFDTETNNSLDPLTCKIMGLCCYVPNTKPVYVPLNHTLPESDELLSNQISLECVKQAFIKLKNSDIKLVYHNGKFDIRVCYNNTGIYLPIWWDTMIGAQLLDENELAKLKSQFSNKIDPTIDSYNIEKLFTGLPYAWIDPEIFGLYAAIDSYDTYLLQKYQEKLFTKPEMEKLYKLFREVELPIVSVTAEMEDSGICLDVDFVNKLHNKYTLGVEKTLKILNEVLEPYKSDIEYYQNLKKLDNPINFESPAQLSIIMYDILKYSTNNGTKSTDKATLKSLKTPFTKALLDYRHYSILIKTFTKPLPTFVSTKDGKVHANFNQMGKEENNVRTGRFSSTNPNLQQIPSKEKIMRMMFKASPGYCIVGGDFSAQEPRILTHMCGDPTFLEVFNTGKDPYATISSLVFKKDYWECMEHHQDGSPNPTGKALRSKAKSIMLGILYGMGPKLMSTMLNVSLDECKEILKEFFKMFPKVQEFTESNEYSAKTIGYVEDYLGRRRHLPDALLDELVVKATKEVPIDTSMFMNLPNTTVLSLPDNDLNSKWLNIYNDKYKNKGLNAKKEFKKLADENKINIRFNDMLISKTMTQCTNARIQGSAATLTKRAMIDIYNNEELKRLGFKLLIPIHDELLGECPSENAEKVEKLLAQTMINSAKPECSVNMSVDTYVVKHWYADELSNDLAEKFEVMKAETNLSDDEVINKIYEDYDVLPKDIVYRMCTKKFSCVEEIS